MGPQTYLFAKYGYHSVCDISVVYIMLCVSVWYAGLQQDYL
jgi:hypothetical protein